MSQRRGRFVSLSALLLVATVFLLPSVSSFGDEGMWTYDHVPFNLLKERYGFSPTPEWLDHLRLSSVNIHASASFVSPEGLILTNHHVALMYVQRLSTPEHNYVRDGFYAKTRAEEILIPGASVRVLISIEDVTAKVEASVKAGATAAQAAEARQRATTTLEAECLKRTGLEGSVVTLYGGATYALYRYKLYRDIRLVFAPELQAAFFGGDFDNFTFPRHDLDMAFLRAYENGEPAHIKDFLAVNPAGAKDGELVFASGHPGSTDRQLTLSALEYLRDVAFPDRLARTRRTIALLDAYSALGPEQSRRARTNLYFLENSRKAREGELRGLQDAALMAEKATREKALRDAVAADPALKREYGKAWEEMAAAYAWARAHHKEIADESEMPGGGYGRLVSTALLLLRYAEEIRKPDADRLNGFHDAEVADTLRRAESPQPYPKDLEELLLADAFRQLRQDLGADDPYVKTVLQGKEPEALAKEILAGTHLDDVAFRRDLLKEKGRAVAKCADPLLELARRVDPTLRVTERAIRDNLDAAREQALTQIAGADFAVHGTGVYPDATGTLRLAFGKVAGYPFATTLVPPFTTFYGLYDRAYSFGNKGDFKLTPSEEKGREKLDLATPLNLVCTADITGGNSGSPLVDREGRLVGLVFDGNMQSHPNAYVYQETEARCVAVDIRAILEALKKLYGADALVQELLSASK